MAGILLLQSFGVWGSGEKKRLKQTSVKVEVEVEVEAELGNMSKPQQWLTNNLFQN